MRLNLKKENYSLGYTLLLASKMGWDISLTQQDDKGYDVTLIKKVEYKDRQGRPSKTHVECKIQLKCSSGLTTDSSEFVSLPLKPKQFEIYKSLKGVNYAIALMIVPEQSDEWMETSPTDGLHHDTLIRHTSYILQLAKHGDYTFNHLVDNQSGASVRFYKTLNRFDEKFLEELEKSLRVNVQSDIENAIKAEILEAQV